MLVISVLSALKIPQIKMLMGQKALGMLCFVASEFPWAVTSTECRGVSVTEPSSHSSRETVQCNIVSQAHLTSQHAKHQDP